MALESPVLKNSIVRAVAKTLKGRTGTMPIATSYSNFSASTANNWSAGAGNQLDVAVTFANEAGANLRPVSGSATIDAGTTDPLTINTHDPDGKMRSLGSAPDIGAYEFGANPSTGTGTGTTGGTATPTNETSTGTTPGTGDDGTGTQPAPGAGDATRAAGATELAPAAAPVAGERVAVEASDGTPRVRLPGGTRFLPLEGAAAVPVGSTVDATSGRIRLTSVRDAAGRTQTGEFWGGVFVVRQARTKRPYTDLVLKGDSFTGCPAPARRATKRTAVARAAARKRRKRKSVVRKLWGRDHRGHFRTHGRNSVVTVRGTVWLVADRCDGTLTRVREGAVVVRQRGRRAVTVTAGRSHLARSPARRQRR
jgi:hypothetical protein